MSDRVDFDYELGNGWSRWQNLVLAALKEQKESQDKLREMLEEIKVETAVSRAEAVQMRKDIDGVSEANGSQQKEIKDLQTDRDRLKGALLLVGVLLVPALIPILTTMIQSVGG